MPIAFNHDDASARLKFHTFPIHPPVANHFLTYQDESIKSQLSHEHPPGCYPRGVRAKPHPPPRSRPDRRIQQRSMGLTKSVCSRRGRGGQIIFYPPWKDSAVSGRGGCIAREPAALASSTIPFRVPIEICAARSRKVNSKGYGGAGGICQGSRDVPVGIPAILFKIGDGGASQDRKWPLGQLDSRRSRA